MHKKWAPKGYRSIYTHKHTKLRKEAEEGKVGQQEKKQRRESWSARERWRFSEMMTDCDAYADSFFFFFKYTFSFFHAKYIRNPVNHKRIVAVGDLEH